MDSRPSCPCAESSEKETRTPRTHLVPMVTQPAPPWSGAAVINAKMQELSSRSYAKKYLVLLFYSCNFSFVCPTEIIQFSDRIADFRALEAEVVAVSTDSKYAHFAWVMTPRKQGGLGEMRIPLLADRNHEIARAYGVLNEKEGTAYRALFVIDRQQNIRQVTINDENLPRSVDEVLRLIKLCCYADEHGSVCPYGPLQTVASSSGDDESRYFDTT
ncbi:peroxiredoxin-2-like [Pseudomyrmex gracilis]|uniref:peroxiredoxin-2-like n=1 Tax=Pseudomyrmex gracilis TaxID=219809 RepID=UPI000995CBB3|nr:peroxiredoxin-2-like [Pseudomyrmex gracilis]